MPASTTEINVLRLPRFASMSQNIIFKKAFKFKDQFSSSDAKLILKNSNERRATCDVNFFSILK